MRAVIHALSISVTLSLILAGGCADKKRDRRER